jgi:hypothetical protein
VARPGYYNPLDDVDHNGGIFSKKEKGKIKITVGKGFALKQGMVSLVWGKLVNKR